MYALYLFTISIFHNSKIVLEITTLAQNLAHSQIGEKNTEPRMVTGFTGSYQKCILRLGTRMSIFLSKENAHF